MRPNPWALVLLFAVAFFSGYAMADWGGERVEPIPSLPPVQTAVDEPEHQPRISIHLRPTRILESGGRESADLAIDWEWRGQRAARGQSSLSIYNDRGEALVSEQIGPAHALASGAAASEKAAIPADLPDDHYYVEALGAAAVGDEVEVDSDLLYFEVREGSILIMNPDAWLLESDAMTPYQEGSL